MNNTKKILVATGWYADERDVPNSLRKFKGDRMIRSPNFHKLWLESLLYFNNIEMIFMTDSASPISPPTPSEQYELIKKIQLTHNPGHSTDHTGHYCGWMASVVLGLEYALMNDFEYFVYVEQDCLLFGENLIEECISKMKSPFMFGDGNGTPQPLQQSFFIIRADGIRPFLARVHSFKDRDSVLFPEIKFELATTRFGFQNQLVYLYKKMEGNKKLRKLFWKALKYFRGYDILPLEKSGRARPIDFEKPMFYFQHGDASELDSYMKKFFEHKIKKTQDKKIQRTHDAALQPVCQFPVRSRSHPN